MAVSNSATLKRAARPSREASVHAAIPLDAFQNYPGVAIVIDRDGAAMAGGPRESALSAALRNDPCWSDIEDGAARAIAERRTTVEIILPAATDDLIEATFMPMENAEQALVLLHPIGFPNA